MLHRSKRKVTRNCRPGQLRDEQGRCGPGIGVSIPRSEMPQIPSDSLPKLRAFLAAHLVEVTDESVPAESLSPAQARFNQAKVDSLQEDTGPVIVSEDDYILDGTHRWVKAWQKGGETSVRVLRIELPLKAAMDLLGRFSGVKYIVNAGPNQPRDEHGRWASVPNDLSYEKHLGYSEEDAGKLTRRYGPPTTKDWVYHQVKSAFKEVPDREFNLSKPSEWSRYYDKLHQALDKRLPGLLSREKDLKKLHTFLHGAGSDNRTGMDAWDFVTDLVMKKAPTGNQLVTNPFVSEAQRRACWAGGMPGVDCAEWQSKTPKGLPYKKKRKGKKTPTDNATNPLRLDPTRTLTLRRTFGAQLHGQCSSLKAAIVKWVRENYKPVANAFCPGKGAEDNSCSSRSNTIEMSPHQYLALAMPFGYQGGPKKDQEKVNKLAKITDWETNPMLSVKEGDAGLQVGLHDGRHRAAAAIQRGDNTIKVDIVRGRKFAREHPEVTDADMAQRVVSQGHLISEVGDKKVTLNRGAVGNAGAPIPVPEGSHLDAGRTESLSGGACLPTTNAYTTFTRYHCPHCGGENAYNGDVENGFRFRGSARCRDCGGTFACVTRRDLRLETDVPRDRILSGTYATNAATCLPILDFVLDIRQRDHFSCGACAAQAVGNGFGVGPKTTEEWKKALGTDVEESTRPGAIVTYLRSLGLIVEPRDNLTIDDLRQYIARGMPVITPCQDYGPEVPKEASFAYGHYLTVIGVVDGGATTNANDCHGEHGRFCGEHAFSPKLESEIQYKLDLDRDDDELYGRNDAIQEIMQESDDKDHPSHEFKKELQDFGIKAGIYREITPEEMARTQVTRGAKYDFKRGGKAYIFDSWNPITSNSNPNQARDEKGRWITGPNEYKVPSDYRGMLDPRGTHFSMRKMGVNGHDQMLEKLLSKEEKPEYVNLTNHAINNLGWSRVHNRGTQLHVETTPDKLEKAKRWVKENVDPHFFKSVEYTVQTLGDTRRVSEDLTENTAVSSTYIVCQDSSADNVIGKSGSIQAKGRVLIHADDWMRLWHDRDVDGNQFVRFGIAVGRGETENAFCPGEGAKDNSCSPKQVEKTISDALTEHGALSTLKLSKKTGIPEDKIYTAVKKLESKGALERGGGNYRLVKGNEPPTAPTKGKTVSAERLQSAIDTVEPQARSGALVSLGQLRKELSELDRGSFDTTIHGLHQSGKVWLHATDYPAGMSKEEKRGAVYDPEAQYQGREDSPKGVYYIGMSLKGPLTTNTPSRFIEVPFRHVPGTYTLLVNANPYHDAGGKFTGASSATVQKGQHWVKVWHGVSEEKDWPDEAIRAPAWFAQTKGMAEFHGAVGAPFYINVHGAKEHDNNDHVGTTSHPVEIGNEGDENRIYLVKHKSRIRSEAQHKVAGGMVDNSMLSRPNPPAELKFRRFIREQLGQQLLSRKAVGQWMDFLVAGYKKGVSRAFDDAKAKGSAAGTFSGEKLAGAREHHLRKLTGSPTTNIWTNAARARAQEVKAALPKATTLVDGAFDGMNDITDDVADRMEKVFARALARGENADWVVKNLAKETDMAEGRLKRLAVTKLTEFHAEGQLDSMEELGVKKVGMAVEWRTNPNSKSGPCERCEAMEGVVLSIKEAGGIIPVHMGCLCAWLPIDDDDLGPHHTTGRKGIMDALDDADLDDVEIDRRRPLGNVFCPTGEGGGVDATCSPGGGKGLGIFGPSTAAVSVDDEALSHLKRMFGKDISKQDVASLVGAPPGGTVTAKYQKVFSGAEVVSIDVESKADGLTAHRDIYKEGSDVIINNGIINIHPDYRGQGTGSEVFGRQVENASRLGVSRITCYADRNDSFDPAEGRNGYYTWPRLGYDMKFGAEDEMGWENYELVHEAYPRAKSVADIMKTKDGRRWWQDNGFAGDMVFDLSSKSHSMKVLSKYQVERSKRKPRFEEEEEEPVKNTAGYVSRPSEEIDLNRSEEKALDATWNHLYRTDNRFCPTGPGGGVDPSCSTGVSGIWPIRKISEALDKVPGAVWLRQKTAAMKDKLISRYGARNAALIIASGQAISWSAAGIGAATGHVVWVPSTLAMAPALALAELHYQLRGAKGATANVAQLSLQETRRLGQELWKELSDVWKARPVSDEDLEEVANAFCPTGSGGGKDNSCSPGGKTGGAGSSLRRRFVRDLQTVPKELRAKYHDAMAAVHDHLSEGELKRLDRGAQEFHFHENTEKLAEHVLTINEILSGKQAAGAYLPDTGELHLDGDAKDHPGSTRGIYAHELGHAIDYHNELSESKAWRDAYDSEIAGGGLTPYAERKGGRADNVNRAEGFAEFCRLLHGGYESHGWTRKTIAERYPLCTKAYKRFGLW